MTWLGSSATLDWTDVARTIHAIEKQHTAVCTFTVSLLGEQFQHRFYLEVTVSTPVFVGAGQLLSVQTCSEWPNGKHESMEAAIYSLLLQADYQVTKQYEQLVMKA